MLLVGVQLLGGIVGSVTTGNTDESLGLLLLLLLLTGGNAHLSQILEGVLLTLADLLHPLSRLLLDWLDGGFLSNDGNGKGGLLSLALLLLLGAGLALIVLGSSGSDVDGVGLGLVEVQVELSGNISGHLSVFALLWLVLLPGVLEVEAEFLSVTLLLLLGVAAGADWGDLNIGALWLESLVEGAWDVSSVWHTLDLGKTDLSLWLGSTLDVSGGDGKFEGTVASSLGQSAEWEFNGGTGVDTSLEFLSEERNLDGNPGVVADNSDDANSSLSLDSLSVVLELSISELGVGGDEERSAELLGQWHTNSIGHFLGELSEHDHLLSGGSVLGESLSDLFLDVLGDFLKDLWVNLHNLFDVVDETHLEESLESLDPLGLNQFLEVDEVQRRFKGDKWESALSKGDLVLGIEVVGNDGLVGAEVSVTLEVLNVQILDLTSLVVVEGAQRFGLDAVNLVEDLTGVLAHFSVLAGHWALHLRNVDNGGGGIGTDFEIGVSVAQGGNKLELALGCVFALDQEGNGCHTDGALAVLVHGDLGEEWQDGVLDEVGRDGFLGSIEVVDQSAESKHGVDLDDLGEIGFTDNFLDLGEDGRVTNVPEGMEDDDSTLANVVLGGLLESCLEFLEENWEEVVFDNLGATEATVDLNWVLDLLDLSVHTSLVDQVGESKVGGVGEEWRILLEILDKVKDFLEEVLGWVLDVLGECGQELELLGSAQLVPVVGDQLGGLGNSGVGSGHQQGLEVQVLSDLTVDGVLDLLNLLLDLLDSCAVGKAEELDGSGDLIHKKAGLDGGTGVGGSTELLGRFTEKLNGHLWDFLLGDGGHEEFVKTRLSQLWLREHLLGSGHVVGRVLLLLLLPLTGLLVTLGLLLLGLLSLLASLTTVDGLTKLDLSLQLRLLLLNAELVAGLLDSVGVLEVGGLLLSILDIDQVEGLLGNGLDFGVSFNSQLNLLLNFSAEDHNVVGILSTDEVADLHRALVEWALVVESVGRLDGGELVEGGVLGELHILDNLDEGLAVTVLLLGLLGSAVGDPEVTERVVAVFLGGGGRRAGRRGARRGG